MENEKLILEQMEKIFPDYKISKIDKLDTGLSSSKIFLVSIRDKNQKFIFKIYPKDYKKRLEKEVNILRELKSSNIPLPNLIHFSLKKLFLIEEYIEGKILYKIMDEMNFDKRIMISVGKSLARIHQLPPKEIWQNEEKIQNKKSWIISVEKRNSSNLKDILQFKIVSENNINFLKKYLKNFIQKIKTSKVFLCPVHGDYNPQNIIINDFEVKGIFDFEIHRIGHNLNDLGIAYYWYKFYAREELFHYLLKGYSEIIQLTNEDRSFIETYYIMQVIGALSFLIKNNLDKDAVLRLKNLLNYFLEEKKDKI
ncbi:MAG: aminoglycoside phosphotransferase family protein [Nanoarchaeota archaeon]|nr:aminoglycoside phosphotransferase family protein [Nanoarchaeota archaeon]